jgi:hypothetical protein
MSDWRDPLVIAWKEFRKQVNRPCDMTWGVLKNRIWNIAKCTDEMTGEILVEPIAEEIWKRQLEGFKINDYARERGYPFGLFQKQFGTYSLPRRIKKYCAKCFSEHYADEKCRELPKAQPEKLQEVLKILKM